MFNFIAGDMVKFRKTERTSNVGIFWFGPTTIFKIHRAVYSNLRGREYFYFADFVDAFLEEDLEHV